LVPPLDPTLPLPDLTAASRVTPTLIARSRTRLDSTHVDGTRVDSTRVDSTRVDSTHVDGTRAFTANGMNGTPL
jgi:hypothetical protein